MFNGINDVRDQLQNMKANRLGTIFEENLSVITCMDDMDMLLANIYMKKVGSLVVPQIWENISYKIEQNVKLK